jgi:hypothetical protein
MIIGSREGEDNAWLLDGDVVRKVATNAEIRA